MRIISTFMLVVVFSALSWSAAFAADHDTRFKTYQDKVKSRDSGVYEIGDDLYVHVRLPIKKGVDSKRQKFKAVFEANNLLRTWMIEQTSEKRNAAKWASSGLEFAASVLDSGNPLWRFQNSNIKFGGQEFTGVSDGFLWLGQCALTADVIKQIPASFSEKPDEETICKMLKVMLPMMVKADESRTYVSCSMVDLLPSGDFSKGVLQEYESINSQIKTFLETSDYAKSIRDAAAKIRGPNINETWIAVPNGNDDSREEKSVLMVTNVLANVMVVTNNLVRKQTKGELVHGFSQKGNVLVSTRISDEKEIVETVTTKIVVTKRMLLRKKQVSVAGSPVFQQMFLSGGKDVCKVSPRTELGDRASKTFFENGVSFESKEKALYDALSENPGDCELWNLYGRCLFLKGETLAALVCFRCAAALDNSNEYVLTNLAITYHKLGCANLGYGYAAFILGVGKSDWCISQSKKILFYKMR